MVGVLLKIGGVALLFNEVRGLVLAAPVLWAMWESGGTLMAIWVGFCSLAGIALSVAVPLFAAQRLKRRFACNLPSGDPHKRRFDITWPPLRGHGGYQFDRQTPEIIHGR